MMHSYVYLRLGEIKTVPNRIHKQPTYRPSNQTAQMHRLRRGGNHNSSMLEQAMFKRVKKDYVGKSDAHGTSLRLPSLRSVANTTLLSLTCFLVLSSGFMPAAEARFILKEPNESKNNANNPISFDGIASFRGPSTQRCSGVVVEQGSALYALANGHCIRTIREEGLPNKVYTDLFSYGYLTLHGNGTEEERLDGIGEVKIDSIAYATMNGTDLQVARFTVSAKELIDALGVVPLVLGTNPVKAGDNVSVVSGFRGESFSTRVEEIVPRLVESNWSWFQTIALTKPIKEEKEALGLSGSPIIDSHGGVVGLINTINTNGENCTLNNPCEDHHDGKPPTVKEGGLYGIATTSLQDCSDRAGNLDFTTKNCSLPPPDTISPEDKEKIESQRAFIREHPSSRIVYYQSDLPRDEQLTRAEVDRQTKLLYCPEGKVLIRKNSESAIHCTEKK